MRYAEVYDGHRGVAEKLVMPDNPNFSLDPNALEYLGRIIADTPIPATNPGRLFDFEPKAKEAIESRARQLGATIIAKPAGRLAKKRKYRGYYHCFRPKPFA